MIRHNYLLPIAAALLFIIGCSSGGDSPPNNGGGNTDGAWTLMDSGTTKNLRAIWGTSVNNIYVAGQDSSLFHFDGSSWSEINLSTSTNSPDIWGSSADNIYMTGSLGLFHFDGNDWTYSNIIGLPSFSSIWLSSATDIYAVGLDKIYHSTDGVNWDPNPVYDNTAGLSTQIRGSSANDIYVAGSPTLHFDGSTWEAVSMGGSPIASGRVFVNASDDVYLVGAGLVYHYDGFGWTSTDPGTIVEDDIWADSSSNIYLSGMVTNSQVGFAHYDGAAWTLIPDETTSGDRINAIWGVSSDVIFGVGAQGKIIRYQAPTTP